MKPIKKAFFLLFPLLILGCATPKITHKSGTLSILDTTIKGKNLKQTQKNIRYISIEQTIFLTHTGETFVYEYARVDTPYKFKYTYSYILGIIFDAKKVSFLQKKSGLSFFHIQTKSKKEFYLLIQTNSKKSFRMVYAQNKENLKALLDEKPLAKSNSTLGIESKWNEKMILTGELLEQEGGRAFY